MKRTQKGFGAIGIVAIVAIVGLVAAVGWLVYDRQKSKSNSDSSATTTNQQEKPEQVSGAQQPSDETASWLQYETSGKEYRFKVADGWILRNKESSNASFYSTDSLALRPGVKGQVLPYENRGVGEFGCGLYWDWQLYDTEAMKQSYKDVVEQYKNSEQIKSTSGVVVYKKSEVLTDGGAYSPEGTKMYSYFMPLGNKSINIGYTVCPNETDNSAVVDKVIKTIQVD